MSDPLAAFDRLSAGAPPVLTALARGAVPGGEAPDAAEALAGAARAVLAGAARGAGAREHAGALLAADALVTMALQVRAREAPDRLAELARAIRGEAPRP